MYKRQYLHDAEEMERLFPAHAGLFLDPPIVGIRALSFPAYAGLFRSWWLTQWPRTAFPRSCGVVPSGGGGGGLLWAVLFPAYAGLFRRKKSR